MKRGRLLGLFNGFVIITEISMRTSFVPELLFPWVISSKFYIILPIFLSLVGIVINRNAGLRIRFDIVKFPPLTYLLILLSLQTIISLFHGSITHVGASGLYLINDLVFALFVNSLLFQNLSRSQKGFNYFSLYNIIVVSLAGILILFSIIIPFSNEVSNRFIIFAGNVETGAVYYWPSWLSIQTMDPRVIPGMGTLMGLTFEPHVFCLLFVPAFFFIISNIIESKSFAFKLVFIAVSILAFILSFSVTAYLALGLVFIVKTIKEIVSSKNYKYLIGVFAFVIFAIVYKDVIFDSLINEYVQTKLTTDTGSMDYSTSRFSSLITPSTLFGYGIMRYPMGVNTLNLDSLDVGAINTLFYLLFLASFAYYSTNLIFSRSRGISFVGCGVLYFFFHSFKLTNSILVMPITIYILCILFVYYKNNRYESITRYK